MITLPAHLCPPICDTIATRTSGSLHAAAAFENSEARVGPSTPQRVSRELWLHIRIVGCVRGVNLMCANDAAALVEEDRVAKYEVKDSSSLSSLASVV